MPPPRAPRHAIEGGLAAVAGGATAAEAASRHGISTRTLERALAERRAKGSQSKPKAKAGKGPTPAADESLLEILVAELRDARRERRAKANTDAENRAWGKTIRELVSAIERIAPPPAVPPDQIQAELRRLDGVTIALIEQFLSEPIQPEEVACLK